MLVTTEAFELAALAQLVAATPPAGILNGAKLGLIAAAFAPSRNLALAGVTEASYTGYARKVITWSAPLNTLLQNSSVLSQLATWQEATTPASVLIYGIMILDSTGAFLYASEAFGAPYPLNTLADALNTVTEFCITNPNQPGTTIVQ